MHAIIGRIKVEDQLGRRLRKRRDKRLPQHPVHGHRTGPRGAGLEPAERRTGAQRRVPLQRALPHDIPPQRIMIVEILVAQRQSIDALPHQRHLLVHDEARMPRIRHRRRKRRRQPQPPIRFPQQHHPTVAGDLAALKTGLDFPPIKAWKSKEFIVTV